MADYKGNTCPVCKQKFKEADDIVVCPDCGTPYHRECWKKVGVCVHQADHAAGFEWTPDNVISDRPDDIVCPNCGTHNPLGAKYCNHCGVSLPDHPDNVQYQQDHPAPGGNGPVYANGSYQADGAPQYRQAPRPEQAPDQEFFSAGSMGPDGFTCKEVGPDDPIDGIKARDWASYVGPSSIYYMMQFFRMQETRRKAVISFSAFFLGPFYFFYRKMWKQGVLFALLDFIVTLPSLLYLMAVSGAEWMVGMPFLRLIPTAMQVCYVLNFIQMVIRGLFAVYWYKKESERRIHRVYDRCPEGPQRSNALAATGGTSWAAVFIYLGVYIAAGVLGSFLMGPDLNAVIRFLTM